MNSFAHAFLRRTLPVAAFALVSFTTLRAAEPAGFVDFGVIPGPSGRGQHVEVQVPRNLVSLAAKIVAQEQPEVAKLLASVESIRVRVVGLDEANRDAVLKRVGEVRAELVRGGWQKVVTVMDDGNDVAVFMRTGTDDVIEGLTVTVVDGNSEAVFVNLVGSIRPDQIAEIARALNVPHLAQVAAAIEK